MGSSADAIEVSVVVTNWNGKAFIEDCLSTLWASGQAWGRGFELLVVDDCSTDGSRELICDKFPMVRLIVNEENVGFARTSNRGALEAYGRVVVMMNNDMKVPREFVSEVVAPFFEVGRDDAQQSLFCVGAKTVDWVDGSPNHLCMRAAWRRGGLGHEWSDPPGRVETTFAQGGSAAFDRKLFLKLGGFSPLFYPTYWDDYDVCYRACKLGWRVLYEPGAVADHLGKATLSRQVGRGRLVEVMERNRVWFTWLNLDDAGLLLRHFLAVPWVYGRDLVQGRGGHGFIGFLRALPSFFRMRRERLDRRHHDGETVRSDRELLGM